MRCHINTESLGHNGEIVDALMHETVFALMIFLYDRNIVRGVDKRWPSHDETINIIDLICSVQKYMSRSEARRLILQGAVEIWGKKITDPHYEIIYSARLPLKIGKHRFYNFYQHASDFLDTRWSPYDTEITVLDAEGKMDLKHILDSMGERELYNKPIYWNPLAMPHDLNIRYHRPVGSVEFTICASRTRKDWDLFCKKALSLIKLELWDFLDS